MVKGPCLLPQRPLTSLCIFPKLALAGRQNPEETEEFEAMPGAGQCEAISHFCKHFEQFFFFITHKTHTRCKINRNTKVGGHHFNNPVNSLSNT